MSREELQHLWEAGQRWLDEGRLDAAVEAFAAVAAGWSETGGPPSEPVAEALADALAQRGDFQTAIGVLVATRTECERNGSAYSVFRLTVRMAAVSVAAGELESASQFLGELRGNLGALGEPDAEVAEPVVKAMGEMAWPGCGWADTAIARAEGLVALARFWAAKGRFESALLALAAVQAGIADSGGRHVVEQAELLHAELQLDMGEARDLVNREPSFSRHGRMRLLMSTLRGRALESLGRLSEARTLLESCLAAPEVQRNPILRAILTLHLAYVLVALNRTDEALRRVAAARCEVLPPRWHARLESVAQLLSASMDSASAESMLPFLPEQVWDIEVPAEDSGEARGASAGTDDGVPFVSPGCFRADWAALANLGADALERRDLAEAKRCVERLAAIASDTDSPWYRYRTRWYQAILAYYQGDYHAARTRMEKCRDWAVRAGHRRFAWEVVGNLAWCELRLGNPDGYRVLVKQASDIRREMERDLDPADRVFAAMNQWSARDEYVAARVRDTDKGNVTGVTPTWVGRLVAGWRRRRAVRRLFRDVGSIVGWLDHRRGNAGAVSPEGSPVDMVPTDVAEWVARRAKSARPEGLRNWWRWLLGRLRRDLPRGCAVVHWYVAPDRLFAFAITRSDATVLTLPVSRVRLESVLRKAIRTILDADDMGVNPRANAAMAEMAELLGLEGLLAQFSGEVQHLFFIPHDVLVNLPLAALQVGHRPLCSMFSVSMLPGLGQSGQVHWNRRKARRGPFLGVSVAEIGDSNLKPLPGVDEEVRRVAHAMARVVNRTTLLTGKAATPDHVIEALSGAVWMHAACHGEFERGAPHRSCLRLSPSEKADGRLLVDTLSCCDCRNLDLAILSACWAASTAVLPGNEMVSFPVAFLDAGARSVIAPLWEVDDATTAEFMEMLAEKLVDLPPSLALSVVQRLCAEGRGPPGCGIHQWASFVCYESP